MGSGVSAPDVSELVLLTSTRMMSLPLFDPPSLASVKLAAAVDFGHRVAGVSETIVTR